MKPANSAQNIYAQMGIHLADGFSPVTNKQWGNWEDLSTMQQTLGSFLIKITQEVVVIINAFRASNFNNAEVRVIVEGINKDIKRFFDRASTLFLRHKDNKGVVPKGDEYAKYMAIGLDYYQLSEDINTTLFTPFTILTEHVNHLHQLQSATNPNVITDVQIKAPVDNTASVAA